MMRLGFQCFAVAAMALAQAISVSAATPAPEPLDEAWWTGPLLAPSAGTLPRGHVLVEPYIYDVMQYGNYSTHGNVTATPHSNNFGSLTYVIYGLTDRLNVGMIPTFGYATVEGGPASSSVGVGDVALLAQYRLAQYHVGRFTPTTSIAVQETFPTGKYDNLGANSNNGFGGGVYSTKVSLYTQSYAWMPTGRILRMRLNLSQTFSGGAPVDGTSVFGTSGTFHGWAKPGGSLTIDGAAEYSITRSWVFASDLVYGFTGDTFLGQPVGVADLGSSHSFAFAPAMEYNWTSNAGIIAGVRFFPAGRNTSASITPVIAINMVR